MCVFDLHFISYAHLIPTYYLLQIVNCALGRFKIYLRCNIIDRTWCVKYLRVVLYCEAWLIFTCYIVGIYNMKKELKAIVVVVIQFSLFFFTFENLFRWRPQTRLVKPAQMVHRLCNFFLSLIVPSVIFVFENKYKITSPYSFVDCLP